MNCLYCYDKALDPIPLCKPCQRELPWHAEPTIAFKYKPPIDQWINLLKFHNKYGFGKILGFLFYKKLRRQTYLPECIVPIPLHRRRLQGRGYNQVIEIAKHLSHYLDIPLEKQLLKRTRATKRQSELNETERQSNVKNAFNCPEPKCYQHIALLDDVMTTGSTLEAAKMTLEQSGIKKVDIWVCAKPTLRQNIDVSGQAICLSAS